MAASKADERLVWVQEYNLFVSTNIMYQDWTFAGRVLRLKSAEGWEVVDGWLCLTLPSRCYTGPAANERRHPPYYLSLMHASVLTANSICIRILIQVCPYCECRVQ